jgi:hypothetical protein
MTNLIDITDSNLSSLLGFMVTPAEVAEDLIDAGLDAKVEWASGTMGSVKVGGAEIIVERGRAFLSRASRARYGHGNARLPSHPLYPAPISHPLCAAIEAVLADLSD